MRNENYINIQGWMVNELHLSGNELLLYALIFGFSQDGKSEYDGSQSYMAESLGITRECVLRTINKLEERGLIIKIKRESASNGKIKYKAFLWCDKKSQDGVIKSHNNCDKKSHNNNIDNNNIKEDIDKSISKKKTDIIIDCSSVFEAWNEMASNVDGLRKVTKTTDKRKRKIISLIKNCDSSIEELIKFIKTIPYADDWVIGKSQNRSWFISFDWLLENTSNWYVSGLEGNMHKKNRDVFEKMMNDTDVEDNKCECVNNSNWQTV